MTDTTYPATVVGQQRELGPPVPRPDVLSAAVVAALGELSDVPKSHDTGSGARRWQYADLADVHSVTRPVLARHGLAVLQDITTTSDAVSVTTLILHVGGERLSFGPFRLACGDGPQGVGSAVTYARRYALMAALGIAASADDDDGTAAQQSTPEFVAPGRVRRQSPPPANPAEGEGVVAGTTAGGGDDPYLTQRVERIEQWRQRLAALDGYEVATRAKAAFLQVGWRRDWTPSHSQVGILEAALKTLEPDVAAAEADRDGTTVDPPAPEPESQDPYEAWTLAALRAEARRRNLRDALKLSKLQLVALLHDTDNHSEDWQ